MNNRFIIKYGEFGAFFYDNKQKKPLTLEQVLEYLTDYEWYKEEWYKRNE